MARVKIEASRVALIGDVVGSRASRDRRALHRALSEVLGTVNADGPVGIPAVITLGDEFQGIYDSLGDALDASFRIRSLLHPHADVRFGVGRGNVDVLDPERGIYDGSAYWNARTAIEQAKHDAAQPRTRTARTAYVSPDDAPGHVDAVQAALDCLDFMVGSLSDTSRTILGGLMEGSTQLELADQLGISASAVSQRVRRDGLGVALEAIDRLGGLP